jgi:hypothetical protein
MQIVRHSPEIVAGVAAESASDAVDDAAGRLEHETPSEREERRIDQAFDGH